MAKFWKIRMKENFWAAMELKRVLTQLKNVSSEDISDCLRRSNLKIYEETKVNSNIFIRITLPFAFVAMIIMFCLLPINFMLTGSWRYKINWLSNWFTSLGF